jgi:hypothetical protein
MASLEICRQESKKRGRKTILARSRIVLNVVFDFDNKISLLPSLFAKTDRPHDGEREERSGSTYPFKLQGRHFSWTNPL